MRILMVSDFYAPLTGGVEQYVESLGQSLVARGHSVAVATLHAGACPEYEEQRGVRIYRVRASTQRVAGLFQDPSRTYAPPWPDPEATAGLRRVLRNECPDVVHGHNWLTHSVLPVMGATSAKLVISMHDYAHVCPKKTLVYENGTVCTGPRLAKCVRCATNHYGLVKGLPTVLGASVTRQRLVDSAAAIVPVSRAVLERSELDTTERSSARVTVIPAFIADDMERQADPTAPCLSTLPDRPFILFVGQLGRHKGIHILLEAYAGLDHPPPLVMIGAQKADTPDCLPAGASMLHDWPHAAVLEAWRRSLCAVVPSVWEEPFGIVALEAMAFGRPVVASQVGGIVDCVLHEQTGLLVPPREPAALRAALQRILCEPGLAERLGRAARERSLTFRASVVAAQMEAVYARVTAPNRATSR